MRNGGRKVKSKQIPETIAVKLRPSNGRNLSATSAGAIAAFYKDKKRRKEEEKRRKDIIYKCVK